MSDFLTLHALHAFPASLLNRDDLNAAKTIPFGGTTRLRVSSQSWKRAMRIHMRGRAIEGGAYGLRTNRLPHLVASTLSDTHDRDRDAAAVKAATVISALGLKANEKTGNTAVQVYVSEHAPARIAASVDKHWDNIGAGTADVPEAVLADTIAAFDVDNTFDLALFGRMIAELPKGGRIDGAASVSHPFSVEAAQITPDFFTAVDDAAAGEAVSSNLGVTDLAAPVLYRHASVNLTQLATNLDNPDLVPVVTREFVDAFISSVPSAKQRSTAATTLPSFVVGVRSQRDTSLADAFAAAIDNADVLGTATDRLFTHLGRVLPFIADAHAVVLPITADPTTQAIELFDIADGLGSFNAALLPA